MVRLTAAVISALNDGSDLATIETLSVPNRNFDQKSKGSVELEPEEEEEEYVILDLDDVFHGQPVPANACYALSGLDTMNPILVLNGMKLIGEYVETVGSVLVYSEREENNQEMTIHSEDFATPTTVDNAKKLVRKVEGMCTLERRLKFRHVEA